MNRNVILRELKKSDFEDIENIIRTTWNYYDYITTDIAKKLAKVYLATCLVEHTYAIVAEIDNRPVGLILGKIKKHWSVTYRIYQIKALIPLIFAKEGRKAVKFYREIDNINKTLLKRRNKNYVGEVILFLVERKYRGVGIGKQLWQNLLSYFKDQRVENFYLYTDTSCNYKFYEYQGMVLQEKHKHYIMFKQEQEEEFYLCDMDL